MHFDCLVGSDSWRWKVVVYVVVALQYVRLVQSYSIEHCPSFFCWSERSLLCAAKGTPQLSGHHVCLLRAHLCEYFCPVYRCLDQVCHLFSVVGIKRHFFSEDLILYSILFHCRSI